MRESVTYQDILQKGEVKGRIEGRQEGRLEEAREMARMLINTRFGAINEAWLAQLRNLSVGQTEELVKALLFIQRPAELTRWFKQHASNGS